MWTRRQILSRSGLALLGTAGTSFAFPGDDPDNPEGRSAVPDGSVIFLRLIQPLSADRSQSVPYETEFSTVTPDGQNQFRLHPVSPRTIDRSEVN